MTVDGGVTLEPSFGSVAEKESPSCSRETTTEPHSRPTSVNEERAEEENCSGVEEEDESRCSVGSYVELVQRLRGEVGDDGSIPELAPEVSLAYRRAWERQKISLALGAEPGRRGEGRGLWEAAKRSVGDVEARVQTFVEASGPSARAHILRELWAAITFARELSKKGDVSELLSYAIGCENISRAQLKARLPKSKDDLIDLAERARAECRLPPCAPLSSNAFSHAIDLAFLKGFIDQLSGWKPSKKELDDFATRAMREQKKAAARLRNLHRFCSWLLDFILERSAALQDDKHFSERDRRDLTRHAAGIKKAIKAFQANLPLEPMLDDNHSAWKNLAFALSKPLF